jgi:hypothetical protein
MSRSAKLCGGGAILSDSLKLTESVMVLKNVIQNDLAEKVFAAVLIPMFCCAERENLVTQPRFSYDDDDGDDDYIDDDDDDDDFDDDDDDDDFDDDDFDDDNDDDGFDDDDDYDDDDDDFDDDFDEDDYDD